MTTDSKKTVTKSDFKAAMDRIDEKFVTRTEFRTAMGKIDKRFDEIVGKSDAKFDAIDARFFGIETRLDRIEENMYTKADHMQFMTWMDEAMTELRDSRDERKLSGHQIIRLDDTVTDHEKRIRVLESSA